MSGTNIKIYRNDVLVHDCTLYRKPDGRIGWYDFVDGSFHAKPENHIEEKHLAELPYVDLNETQYIDTGYRPNIVPDLGGNKNDANQL